MTRLIVVGVAIALVAASVPRAEARRRYHGRIILGFDRAAALWTVKACLTLLPTAGPVSVWRVKGEARCHADDTSCPGDEAPLVGTMIGDGQAFTLTAGFDNGVTCAFAGTLPEPDVPGTTVCTAADGTEVLRESLHVGLCRYHRGRLCRPTPCPYPRVRDARSRSGS